MDKYLHQFIQYLQQERRLSLNTVLSYHNDLKQFQAYLSLHFDLLLLHAKPEHIRSWMVSLKENGLSNRSINRKIASIRAFYKYLLTQDSIQTNPAALINTPKIEKRLPVFVSENEMHKLFEQIEFPDNIKGWRDKLILELFYYTGMRRNELIHLTLSDIDLYNQTVKVLGKRNKERIVPLHPNLTQTLKQYLSLRQSLYTGSDLLFVSGKHQALNPRTVYRIVKKYLDLITTVNKRSPHIIRHTFATHMLNNGADLNSIKEILGHANLSATQVYTHNTMEKIKKIHQQAHPRG